MALAAVAAGIALLLRKQESNPGKAVAPTFVGRAACASCHQAEARAWVGSHHDLAMDMATDSTVLGNFESAEFRYGPVVTRFSKRDGRYYVLTDGPDGTLQEFRITHTFGVDPLQQYLVELPGGRLQALSIAWDSRPAAQGGQRWFHLYPNDHVTHTDVLHWTRRSQNWNHMCAECHSTNVRKNYRADTQTYQTSWSEIDVSCEACHGPGSRHVAWAKKPAWWRAMGKRGDTGLEIGLDERRGVTWSVDAATGQPSRSVARGTEKEIQMCARCHSRRSEIFEGYRWGQPLLQTHMPALLTETLYHADGQIEGEVYEYGSFLQSRMYHAGVTCSDCHDPHSLALRGPGNQVCLQCHSAPRYDSTQHHFHATSREGSRCVECHMPVRTYMVVDPRHDHSFRVPRPDLSVRLGTPNACNDCHHDRPASWAAQKVVEWYKHEPRGFQTFAEAFQAARSSAATAEVALVDILRDRAQPNIARATAAGALQRWPSQASATALGEATEDPDPLVRIGAAEGLAGLPPERRWAIGRRLLRDPVRVVRVEAVGLLADAAVTSPSVEDHADLDRAGADYIAAQAFTADQPEGLVNLGNFYAARGNATGADSLYRAALRLDPDWVPGYVNLADLLRAAHRDEEGERILRSGLGRAPDSALLHYSLGLLLVRKGDKIQAMTHLERAATLAPDQPRFVYVYAVGLHSMGRPAEARTVVQRALARMPGDPTLRELQGQLNTNKERNP
jgi:tetratricopeptide (TPR) repeat protein